MVLSKMTPVTMFVNWNIIPILNFTFMSNFISISGALCGCIINMFLIQPFATFQIRWIANIGNTENMIGCLLVPYPSTSMC